MRCADGSDQTGSDEYDFSLSAIQDGLQLSVDRAADTGQYGDGVQLDDITNFEDPSVSWSAPPLGTPGGEPFVEVDGKEVRADASFGDGTDPTAAPVAGSLEATCP